MKNCYINGIGTIGIQHSEYKLLEQEPQAILARNQAQHPVYKELIPAASLRRMATGVKMGCYAAQLALQEAQQPALAAIICGTGQGCLQDSEKFLSAMIGQDEEYLTPTSFIQSTHNTVAAQIALQLQCHAYNFTYVQGGSSFESALFDGLNQLNYSNAQHILVGGVDEHAPQFDDLYTLAGNYKAEGEAVDFKTPTQGGVAQGEGANFFLLSQEQQANSYAQLLDVWLFNQPQHRIADEITRFLSLNNLQSKDIDVLMLGYNADASQQSYFDAMAACFPETAIAYYQHISGSYDTASAYGLAAAAQVLKAQQFPAHLSYNSIKPNRLKTILLINQSRGTDYSFVLLTAC